jgi:GNAT superfamily N-acetyltransferase
MFLSGDGLTPCIEPPMNAMNAEIVVQPVPSAERAQWEPLWKAYLEFYKTSVTKEIYDSTWARLHDPEEPMFVLGAYVGEKLIGIAHYLFHRSCWTIGDYCYLQDLFVAEEARKLGTGRALIEAVEKAARAAGASRVYWLTHETNTVARGLYDKLADRPGFIQYRKLF